MNQWLIMVIVLAGIAAAVYLIFRPRMDKRVAALAAYAFTVTAHVMELEPKGEVPPVSLKSKPVGLTNGRYLRFLRVSIKLLLFREV